jgi:hypothetical protein
MLIKENKREEYKIIVKDEKRKLKPAELLKATTVPHPISQTYQQVNQKKYAKLINRFIGHMTKQDAFKAKKNSLSPAQSTWNNDRKSRSSR